MRKGQKMPEEVKRKISESEKGKHVSLESRAKMRKRMLGKTGDKSIAWTGDEVGYWGIHDWLYTNYGKASRCEMPNCFGRSKVFQWAKIREKEYERKRENFWQLCVSCHNAYDMTEEKKEKISKTLKIWFQSKK